MHELGIARDLWHIIENKSKSGKLKKIEKVTVCVGVNSGIEKDFLAHSLRDHVFPSTIAKDAVLEIKDEDVRLKCNSCGEIIDTKTPVMNCPKCGNQDFDILSGKDVYIYSVEGS